MYQYLYKHLVNDSLSMSRFPNWWTHYLRSVTDDKYRELILIRSWVYSKAPYGKSETDSVILKAVTHE